MILSNIAQLLHESKKPNNELFDQDVDQFVQHIDNFDNEKQAFDAGKDKFGKRWFAWLNDMINYCAARSYTLPHGPHRELQDQIQQHKDTVLHLKNITRERGGEILNDKILTKLQELTGYMYTGKKDILPRIITGWIRKNRPQKTYESILSTVEQLSQNNDDITIANQLTKQYGNKFTDYHVYCIRQEIAGKRDVDMNWWKEELFVPWLKHIIEQPEVINTQELFSQCKQVFGDRITMVRPESLPPMLKQLGAQNKMRNKTTLQRMDDFIENNKRDIMDILNNPLTSKEEQIEILNYKYVNEAPRKFDESDVTRLRRQYGNKKEFIDRKQTTKKETLRLMVDELKEMRKTMSTEELIRWIYNEKGIKTDHVMLSSIGAIPIPQPVRQTSIMMNQNKAMLYQMRREGKSQDYIERWLLHNCNIKVTSRQIDYFFSNYPEKD